MTLPPPPVTPRPSPGVSPVARLSSTSSAPTLTRIPQPCMVSPPATRTLSRRASTDAPVYRPIPAAKDDDIDSSSAMNRARVVARTALTSSGNYGEAEAMRPPTPRLRQQAATNSVVTRATTVQSPHSNYSILPMSPEQPLSDGEYGVLSLAPADNHRHRLTSNRRR